VYLLTSLAGFEGLFQGHFRFCATFALLGVYDFSGSAKEKKKEKGRVSNQMDRRKDLWAMLKIHIYSLVASLVLSLIVEIF